MPANQLVACFPTLPSPKFLCHLLSHLLKLSTSHNGTLSTKHIKGCFSVLFCRYYYFSYEAGCMPSDSATHYAGGKEVLGRTLQTNAYIFRAFPWWHHLGCYMGLYSLLPGRHYHHVCYLADCLPAILSPNKGLFYCTCLDTVQILLIMAVKGDSEMLWK